MQVHCSGLASEENKPDPPATHVLGGEGHVGGPGGVHPVAPLPLEVGGGRLKGAGKGMVQALQPAGVQVWVGVGRSGWRGHRSGVGGRVVAGGVGKWGGGGCTHPAQAGHIVLAGRRAGGQGEGPAHLLFQPGMPRLSTKNCTQAGGQAGQGRRAHGWGGRWGWAAGTGQARNRGTVSPTSRAAAPRHTHTSLPQPVWLPPAQPLGNGPKTLQEAAQLAAGSLAAGAARRPSGRQRRQASGQAGSQRRQEGGQAGGQAPTL